MKRGTEGREGSRAWRVENAPARGLQGSAGQGCPGGDGAAPAESEQRIPGLAQRPLAGTGAPDAGVKNLCPPLSLYLSTDISPHPLAVLVIFRKSLQCVSMGHKY